MTEGRLPGAMAFGRRGILVNSIQPGLIRSGLAAAAFAIPSHEALHAREIPPGRVGEPADVAQAVLWLAQFPYITGANLPPSGGRQLTRSVGAEELAALDLANVPPVANASSTG